MAEKRAQKNVVDAEEQKANEALRRKAGKVYLRLNTLPKSYNAYFPIGRRPDPRRIEAQGSDEGGGAEEEG